MQDLMRAELQKINQFFIEGLNFKALDALDDFVQKKDLSSEEQLICYILKSNIFNELGRYVDALKFAELACSVGEELGNKSLLLNSYISKAWTLLDINEMDAVPESLTKGEALLKQLTMIPKSDFAQGESILKLIRSAYFFYKSHDMEKALKYGEESLRISEGYGNKKEIALALQYNSWYYTTIGNLDQALDYLERCLRVQRSYRKCDDWRTLKDLGVLNGIIGELDLALKFTKESLALTEEIGNKNYIAQCLNNSSLIYRQKGNLDLAREALERSLTIWKELDIKIRLIGCLDSLFIVSLDANSLKQAEQYLLNMQQINEQLKDKMSNVACRVNKALLLKMSLDSRDKQTAKEILQQVVEEEIINWEFTERALLHLCDIFLFELQAYNNQENLREVDHLLNRLTESAKAQHSFRLLAETYLLQGKLAIIQMNMGDARQCFTKAERIADDHGLHLLARTVSTEHDALLEQLEKWEMLRKSKTPVSERLKLVDVDKTLDHMMGKKMLKPPDLVEEDPILLIIMSEAGNAYFNHTFIKNWDYSSLFSSFISAFNSFSSEIFAKTIDRIKIGKNTIFIKPVEPFVACYVSKGQSYPAIKKLNEFSYSIKNKKEIWSILNKAAETSQELNVNNSPFLRTLVNKIFGKLSFNNVS
ncbi:MAG: tetratricopeptide repeat protein [Candidatus Heimdallarchaeota archaeon]